MLTQEMVVTIKVLSKQGQSIKAIARETGLARNTVRKYLQQDESTTHQRQRTIKPSKLDPFKSYIQGRIEAAAPDWIPASVLYAEMVELGYEGKIRIVSSYIRQFKALPKPDPLVRFETEIGQQMQVDFTTIKQGKQTLKAFVATLGYSRASFVYFYDNERTEAWMDGLQRSFEFFQGVPKEILFDNAKAIVIERDAYGDGHHRWNPLLLEMAKDYGFRPRLCRPYRAKTKGKVERFNRYLKSSFIVPLQATLRTAGLLLDVQIANGHIGRWLEMVANAKVHGTTGDIPNERLQFEQAHLLPLPMCIGNVNPITMMHTVAVPIESLQQPLSLYHQLFEVSA